MIDISSLMTHGKDLILIDEILDYDDNFITCQSTIKEDNPFLEDNNFPNYAYIELIAQGISVLAGLRAKKNNIKLDLNLLLGCRNLEIFNPSVNIDTKLTIKAKSSLENDDGLGIYTGELLEGDKLIAKGNFNVYSPSLKGKQ